MSWSRLNGKRVLCSVVSLMLGYCLTAGAADTVQVNIKSLLNGRTVTTYTNGKLYTWKVGVDGGDGYVTHSAAVHLNYTGHTLPDSALYPANANHPTMILNWSNSDSTGPQTRSLSGVDSVIIPVPQGNYSKVYLALTNSGGASTTLGVVLNYLDGPITSSFLLNDYDQGLAPGVFYVDSVMQKWSNTNSPNDNYGHELNGFGVASNSAKTLTSVKLVKNQNNAGSFVLLWGVTGVGSNITTSVLQQPARLSSGSVRMLSCRDGRMQFLNVKAGVELSVFSLKGERVARVASARQGTLTLGNHSADATVCPGVYICELRQGQEIQRLQAIVGK